MKLRPEILHSHNNFYLKIRIIIWWVLTNISGVGQLQLHGDTHKKKKEDEKYCPLHTKGRTKWV